MPLKMEQYEKSLSQPPLCEQLKVRDLTDDLLIQLNGSFVGGYRVSGIHSYYAVSRSDVLICSSDFRWPNKGGG